MSFLFSSESVSEGHPDKVCDQISDAILDECLKQDPESRVACETMCTAGRVIVAGEITTRAEFDPEAIARNTIREIGYTNPQDGFDADSFAFESYIHTQSPDISQGVTVGQGKFSEQGAGDQGMMFGFAINNPETEYMPEEIFYSHRLMEKATLFRKTEEIGKVLLKPDAKCQLTFEHLAGALPILRTAVVSHQHSEEADQNDLEKIFQDMIVSVIPGNRLLGDYQFYFNPTGKFVKGGPAWDTGLTGRKIVVDTYGGYGKVGGGAFSGKDPSKVDRSAAYMCRHVAKHLVKQGLCQICELQVAYAIGVAEPVSILVDCNDNGPNSEELVRYIKDKFDFRPEAIIERFGLKHPEGWSYKQTAKNGHFGHPEFPWEKDVE